MSPRHVLPGGFLLLGHRAGRSGGRWASGLLGARGPRHFGVRPWAALRAPVAAMCPPWLGSFSAAGGAAPPFLAQASGRPQAALVACPWRVVSPTLGWPLTLGGRRRTSWMLCLPPGGGPLEALPAARARLA